MRKPKLGEKIACVWLLVLVVGWELYNKIPRWMLPGQ